MSPRSSGAPPSGADTTDLNSTYRDTTDHGFPVVRRGYDRAAVDHFTRSARAEISELRRSYEVLAARCSQLQEAASHGTEGLLDAARLEAKILLADAERDALGVRREVASARDAMRSETGEAEQLVARVRQQVATLEERSRQELAWRRRQLRQETELLARRQQAMLSQLASLSALASQAHELPELPELPAL